MIVLGFSGSLYSFIAVPSYLREVNTLEEVNEHARTVYIYAPFEIVFASLEPDDVMWELSQRFSSMVTLEDVVAAGINIARGGERAMMSLEVAGSYFLLSEGFADEAGRPLLRLAGECAYSPAYVSFVTRLHSPLLPRLDAAVQRFVSAGIFSW